MDGSLRAGPGKREGSPCFQATTSLYPRQIQTHSGRKQPAGTRYTFSTVTESSSPTSQARISEEAGRARTTNQGARKKEKSKTDLRLSVLRTGEKTKLEDEFSQPGHRSCRMEGGLFRCWPSGVEGIRGLG